MVTATITIKGMHCTSCIALLTEVFDELPGMTKATVSMGSATVVFTTPATKESIVEAITKEGYDAQ